MKNDNVHHVLIIGGGFGGLYAAKQLRSAPVKVTLVDKRNFHLFQPLLYQVATGGLSPGDISYPLRAALNKSKNTYLVTAEVVDIDAKRQKVILHDGELDYDTLIVAAGVSYHYFGNDGWEKSVPGLKTVENALEIRRRIFLAFEAAERELDPENRRKWMTFVVVGGGPTGVELTGALGELAHSTLKNDFKKINPAEAEILLLEGTDRILPSFPPELSLKAENSLNRLGVTVLSHTLLEGIEGNEITIRTGEHIDRIQAHTVLWAAGVKASPLGRVIAENTGAELDHMGRVIVEPNLSLPGHSNIFVIGDLANYHYQDGKPLPGVAPVAMQQGRYVANLIKQRFKNKNLPPFYYNNKGNLAVIGRNAAVAHMGFWRFGGFPAWLIWVLVHIGYLIGFDNKFLVLFQWAWNYITRKRGARLITGEGFLPWLEYNKKTAAKLSTEESTMVENDMK